MKKGGLIVHAGGRPVLVDQLPVADVNKPPEPVDKMLVADDGRTALIRCIGPKSSGIGEQLVELHRPSRLTVDRHCSKPLTWWCAGDPQREDNSLVWPDGARLTIIKGTLTNLNPQGYIETKVHYGGMKFADPQPFTYPTITAEPKDGRIMLEVVIK
jgi:hypothetical protein